MLQSSAAQITVISSKMIINLSIVHCCNVHLLLRGTVCGYAWYWHFWVSKRWAVICLAHRKVYYINFPVSQLGWDVWVLMLSLHGSCSQRWGSVITDIVCHAVPWLPPLAAERMRLWKSHLKNGISTEDVWVAVRFIWKVMFVWLLFSILSS